MSGPRITDAAVEAVREAFKSATDSDEEAISDESDLFRFILTSALPHIRRAVIEELVEKAESGAPDSPAAPRGTSQWLRAELEGGDRA